MKISFMGLIPKITNKEADNQKDYSGYRLLKNQPSDSLEISFKGARKMNELPIFINKLVEELKKSKTNGDVYNVFKDAREAEPDFKAINPALYEYKGYRVHSTLQGFSDELVKKLEYVNKLKIDSAPRLVKYMKMGQGESIVITHLQGCENEAPIPYREFEGELSQKAKEIFMDDMNKLAERGLVHKYAARGTSSWAVNPKTGHIMLNNWDSLQKVQKFEVDEGLEDIKENLNFNSIN